MKNNLVTERFYSREIIPQGDHERLVSNLSKLNGMESVHLGRDFVEVGFIPQVQTVGGIRQKLTQLSFDFKDTSVTPFNSLLSYLKKGREDRRKPFSGPKGHSCCG